MIPPISPDGRLLIGRPTTALKCVLDVLHAGHNNQGRVRDVLQNNSKTRNF